MLPVSRPLNIWFVIPSRLLDRARGCVALWRSRGYRTAMVLPPDLEPAGADLTVHVAYPGYFAAVNLLSRLVVARGADIVVTGGDDLDPDPWLRAQEIGEQFLARFPDTFGIMQPVGGELPHAEATCSSPWMGRAWIERAYRGTGPFWPEYTQFFGDVELLHVARRLGVLWQRHDVVQQHHHYGHGIRILQYQQEALDVHYANDLATFSRRRDAGWPASAPLDYPGAPSAAAVRTPRLTFGISTACAVRHSRVLDTVESLLADLRPDAQGVRFVLFGSEPPQLNDVRNRYAAYVAAGVLHIASSDVDERLDPEARRVLSAARLMEHCAGESGYYIHLEDDVIAGHRYVQRIQDWVAEHDRPKEWVVASFHSGRDAAGQLIRAGDLPKLSAYLRERLGDAPLESLIDDYVAAEGGSRVENGPLLFQRLGLITSLAKQFRRARAATFVGGRFRTRLRIALRALRS